MNQAAIDKGELALGLLGKAMAESGASMRKLAMSMGLSPHAFYLWFRERRISTREKHRGKVRKALGLTEEQLPNLEERQRKEGEEDVLRVAWFQTLFRVKRRRNPTKHSAVIFCEAIVESAFGKIENPELFAKWLAERKHTKRTARRSTT